MQNAYQKNEDGIVEVGSPILRHRAREVTLEELHAGAIAEVVNELLERLPLGVGVAAPQVGYGLRIIVVEDTPALWERCGIPEESLRIRERTPLPRQVLVNPVLTPTDDEMTEFMEGCLSVGKLDAVVRRFRRVHLKALTLEGRAIEADYRGWPARILQHEVDHLDGVLFVDRMESRSLCSHSVRQKLFADLTGEQIRDALNSR